jgi:hypothetical protein
MEDESRRCPEPKVEGKKVNFQVREANLAELAERARRAAKTPTEVVRKLPPRPQPLPAGAPPDPDEILDGEKG